MQPSFRYWWLTVPAAIAAVWLGAAVGQQQLRDWTQRRLVRQHRQQIAASSDRRAARLVLQLADGDERWLDAIVAAWADPRRSVAQAGQVAVEGLVQRWSVLPAEEAAPRLSELARLLAEHAPQMSDGHREAAQSLAQRLLDLPSGGPQIDVARYIADCETVLRLPQSPPEEIRLAALPAATAPSWPPLPAPAASLPISAAPASPPTLRPLQSPPALSSPDAGRGLPAEPQRLPVPKAKALKISDDE